MSITPDIINLEENVHKNIGNPKPKIPQKPLVVIEAFDDI